MLTISNNKLTLSRLTFRCIDFEIIISNEDFRNLKITS